MTIINLASGSLSGLRILDLTRVWAGPLATRIYGDYGADVIKISDPRVPLVTENGLNSKLNRNKRNIGLRLDKSEGRQIFLELTSISDLVIENFRPRVMRNLDLTYETLLEVNPHIIMCSMPGFGLEGPYAEYPAFGTTAEALAGIPGLIGYDDSLPISSGIAYGDPVSGLNAVGILLTALRQRNITGSGQFIDIALAASPACNLGEFFGATSSNGYQPVINGNKSIDYCPHGAYRVKGDDVWVAISVTDETSWKALVKIVDDSDLESEKYFSFTNRKHDEAFIDRQLSDWFISQEANEVMVQLQKAGISAGAVLNNRQLLSDPHLNERGFFVDMDEPRFGIKRYDGQSILGNHVDKSYWQTTKDVGESSEEILIELLGYTSADCKRLAEEETVLFQ
ncbi:MAG: CoA transferase [Chloroflexota bacterium]|nr:CoA transferase [Chloroflexota bacterium]